MSAARPRIRRFVEADRAAVVDLWKRSGLTRPWNDAGLDIDRKLAHDGTILLAVDADRSIVGTVMVGYDGHRGWINYLAVDPLGRRSGTGRRLVEAAERHLVGLGCPKVNLQIREDNPAAITFYEVLGYAPDAVVSMGKRLVHDDATEAEDDPGEDSDAATLVELETSMWRWETRSDRAWMEARLAPEFTEHGWSGRRYTRAECLDLPVGGIDIELPLRDVRIAPLGDRTVLVTYRSVEARGDGNRCSIWRSTSSGWQLVFHQGTPV